MEVANQPKLRFHGVDIINIKFSTTQQYDGRSAIKLNIEPKVYFPDNNNSSFNIFMEVSIKCDEFFELSLLGIGNFEFDSQVTESSLRKTFVNVNAPAIMFPYIRSFISTLSGNLGRTTGLLIIPTQFFQGELQELVLDEQ